MNQLINMAIRIIMRKGIGAGINKAMAMFRGGQRGQNNPPANNQDQVQPPRDEDRNV